jgi:hypothetical protein
MDDSSSEISHFILSQARNWVAHQHHSLGVVDAAPCRVPVDSLFVICYQTRMLDTALIKLKTKVYFLLPFILMTPAATISQGVDDFLRSHPGYGERRDLLVRFSGWAPDDSDVALSLSECHAIIRRTGIPKRIWSASLRIFFGTLILDYSEEKDQFTLTHQGPSGNYFIAVRMPFRLERALEAAKDSVGGEIDYASLPVSSAANIESFSAASLEDEEVEHLWWTTNDPGQVRLFTFIRRFLAEIKNGE